MNGAIFKEIIPHTETASRFNDVTINAGASQSTLQDINLPEFAGCFTYSSNGSHSTCNNRFIYWRSSHDVIELVETSLDFDLKNSQVRLRFQNTPILRGVSIHEYRDSVVLLVPTVSAIHKLVFPHPKSLEQGGFQRDPVLQSVFYDTSLATLKNRSCFFVLNHVSLGVPLPHTSCSWLDAEGNATFVLANSGGSVMLMAMSDRNDIEISTTELMKTSSFSKLLNGLLPTAIRSSRPVTALGIACLKTAHDTFIISVLDDLQIKIWSHKRKECVLSDSILNYDCQKNLSCGNFTAHQCHLRTSSSGSSFYIGVYVPMPQAKTFYVFKPKLNTEEYKLDIVSIFYQASNDLVDFCVTQDRLWTLWLTNENQPCVLSACFQNGMKLEKRNYWMPSNLEQQLSSRVDHGKCGVQEAYLKKIFKVGQFLPSTIMKAINTYNTAKNVTLNTSSSLKVEDLMGKVIDVVERDVLSRTQNLDMMNDINLQVATECWDRFLSYCIQYHEVGMKPLGIAADSQSGLVMIIKKNFYSLLSPCDPLEVFTNPTFQSHFSMNLLEDAHQYFGLKSVLECISLLRQSVDEKFLSYFNSGLSTSQYPIKYATEICKSIELGLNNDFYKVLQSQLPPNTDLIACIEYLLKILDLNHEVMYVEDSYSHYTTLLNSSSGIGLLCSGLFQFVKQRFEFCRDLLLLELILYSSDVMDYDQLDVLFNQSAVIQKTSHLVSSYFLILWSTQQECATVSSTVQDAAFKQFCLLEMPEFTSAELTSISHRQTVCHLFFKEIGGSKIKMMLTSNPNVSDNWQTLYPALIRSAVQLLWPSENGVIFPEFLYSHCQHLSLQEYNHMFQSWCRPKHQFINFLVASSCLILGESQKALKLFLNVSKDVNRDTLLHNKILKGHYAPGSQLISSFSMKVIQLLEQFSFSECIVQLTTIVVSEIDATDPLLPTFYSVLFKHHLSLGHFEDSYAVLVKNPDSSAQKDCLRQLVVKLCELKQFQKIIDLSYLAYGEEVVSILESRARCSDLSQNTSFYGILYSLHISHRKFRRAACVMHEQAMRFGREVSSLKGLEKQASCYLAAINCLSVEKPKYAWIASPAVEGLDSEDNLKSISKRDFAGGHVSSNSCTVKFEVFGLEDIRKEYKLVNARLLHAKLYANEISPSITPLSAEETVALLLNAGLFDDAIQLSNAYGLSLETVFEAIAYKCITSSQRSEGMSSAETDFDKFSKQSDLAFDFSGQKIMWKLLEKYLLTYEKFQSSELHYCVVQKLLAHNYPLPAWLVASFQKRNFTELISLYINYGMFEDSLVLMHKYVKAVLGEHPEDFNLKFCLHINSPPVWLPHTYIDIILDAGSHFMEDDNFRELYEEFLITLDKYDKIVETISKAKTDLS